MDNSKGQKMSAAIYLVTNHIADNDPLRTALRVGAVELVAADTHTERSVCAARLIALLAVAVYSGLISEKNASIISLELKHFTQSSEDVAESDVRALFIPTLNAHKGHKDTSQHRAVFHSPIEQQSRLLEKSNTENSNKDSRQRAILSFINNRKSAGIKDIASLFPGLSEKTIQRELGSMVAKGMITKRGDKRWSIYMAVGEHMALS